MSILKNLSRAPDADAALRNYRELADGYDASCSRIEWLRVRAVQALQLRPGDTVFDIACGTGPTLPLLADAVGAEGQVVGVEMSPEMAAQARQRVAGLAHAERVSVVVSSVESFTPEHPADALLLSYTHDVLQSPEALTRLLQMARPGARIVILGLRTLPWWWGWPVNLFNLYRARRYLTTYANLDCPWRALAQRGARLRELQRALWGSAYIAVGTLP